MARIISAMNEKKPPIPDIIPLKKPFIIALTLSCIYFM